MSSGAIAGGRLWMIHCSSRGAHIRPPIFTWRHCENPNPNLSRSAWVTFDACFSMPKSPAGSPERRSRGHDIVDQDHQTTLD